MGGLCLTAYAFGSAIRFNIAQLEELGSPAGSAESRLERLASWSLAIAYIISVAYYLNLFGAFGVSMTSVNDSAHAKLLTSAMFLLILLAGWSRGFSALERMEKFSVSLKLAIIAGMLAGLTSFFWHHATHGELIFSPPDISGWASVTLAFGLIVTVQGFETSRYLGTHYSAPVRIRSMRLAQWLSTGIYMLYILLLSFAFAPSKMVLSETAIIDMMTIVAPILPILLIAAALSAQFSAAIADTGGAGGLFAELTNNRLSQRQSYAVLVGIGLLLTWWANIFEIISYASRAFALYYALQAAIALLLARRSGAPFARQIMYAGLAGLGLLMALFGVPVEG